MPRVGLSTAAVVHTALEILDERGPQSLTLAAVATRSGVAAPSLYKHVDSLDALHQKVAAAVTAEIGDVLTIAVAGRSGRDALLSLAEAYRGYAVGHPGRYPLAQRVPDSADQIHVAAGARAVGAVFSVLRGYGLTGNSAIDATRVIRSSLHGFVSLEIEGGFGLARELSRSFDRLVTGLDAALREWPADDDQ